MDDYDLIDSAGKKFKYVTFGPVPRDFYKLNIDMVGDPVPSINPFVILWEYLRNKYGRTRQNKDS